MESRKYGEEKLGMFLPPETRLPEQKNRWWLRTPKPVVSITFDGVIHPRKGESTAPTHIQNPPHPGIREAIAHLRMAGYRVVVVSNRCFCTNGRAAIGMWLHDNDILVDNVREGYPPSACCVDDCAICFDGNAGSLLEKVINFKPWNHTEK